jgi:high-affinity iron transporter
VRARPLRFILFVMFAVLLQGPAKAETGDVETTGRLLDYIAVDYANAVAHGQVSSPWEYAEQNEFAAMVADKLHGLPAKPEKEALLREADRLKRAIAEKAEPEQVARSRTAWQPPFWRPMPCRSRRRKLPTLHAARRP